MTKPMLIEALKPGQKAKAKPKGAIYDVYRGERFFHYGKTDAGQVVSDVDILTATDYEIIEDQPKPWEPTDGDRGYTVLSNDRVWENIDVENQAALPTWEAAKHAAKLRQIITGIMRMPGYGGDGPYVWWSATWGQWSYGDLNCHQIMDYPFDTSKNAEAAAEYANKLMDEMQSS